ncbi:MAG: histidine kinase dimerization/phospho-acceptor domain-containing protein [Bacillus sp. (in: firmicutes)]
MDTKWKNKKKVWLSILLFSLGVSALIYSLLTGREFYREDYYHSRSFESEKNSYLQDLSTYVLSKPDVKDLVDRITVTDSDIEEYRYQYGTLDEQISSIKAQYAVRIEEAEQLEDEELKRTYEQERNKKIKDITENFTNEEHVRSKILKERAAKVKEEYRQYFQASSSDKMDFSYNERYFDFYLEDEDGNVFTSLSGKQEKDPAAYFSSKNTVFVEEFGQDGKEALRISEDDLLNNWLSEPSYIDGNRVDYFSGYIGIPKDRASIFTENENAYNQVRWGYILLLVAGAITGLAGTYMLVRTRPFTEDWYPGSRFGKFPSDLRWLTWLFFCLFGFAGFGVVASSSYLGYRHLYFPDWLVEAGVIVAAGTIVGSLIVWLSIQNLNLLIKRGVWDELTIHSWTAIFLRAARQAFLNVNIGIQLIILLAGFTVAGFLLVYWLFVAIYHFPILFSALLAFLAIFIFMALCYPIMKKAGYFNRIVIAISALAKGQNIEDLPIKGKSIFAELARDVNSLKSEVKLSQREQMKSERLKTELITNVSHDLRTPLTSIITYADLLKADDLTEEDRNNYINIIDRKSKRLKVLIDDLFEASKMATGNISLQKSQVDIIQLLQQALAEYEEKIEQSELQFRIKSDDPPILMVVDGQKMWRVFDNLIGNTLKYSHPGTRVYIHVKEKEDQVSITFKNVAKYELGCDVDELFERFKRGDSSRHTEGSGLGLAIAKSIVDLHGGTMDIEVDGDLFTVTILLDKV